MSGYFQRLIARSMGAGSDVRPLSPQPYANLAHEKSPAGNGAPLTVINTPRSASAAEVANPAARRRVSPAETTGVTDTPDAADAANANDSFDSSVSSVSIWRHTDASAVTDGMSGARTTASGAAMNALSGSISGTMPQNSSPAIVNRQSLPAQHAISREEAVVRPTEQTAQRATAKAAEAEAFHLMPLQSPSLAHNTVSPPTGASFSSFFPARAETTAPSQTHLSASKQYSHHAAVSESPMIQVTIGRIEIRAAVASASARKTSVRSPAMSLDDYLKQRNGGRR